MKKILIGIVIAVLVLVAAYFILPANIKNVIEYQRIRMFDEETYAEIQVMQNVTVLGYEDVTYGEIVDKVVAHEYWTYETAVTADGAFKKIITANGDGVSMALGENDDMGYFGDSELQFVFTLDTMGGYDIDAYMDGTLLSKEDRNALLAEMVDMTK